MFRKKKLPFDPEAGKALSSLAPGDQKTLDALGSRAWAEAASKTGEPKTLVLSEKEREAQKRFDLQLGPEGGGTEAKK